MWGDMHRDLKYVFGFNSQVEVIYENTELVGENLLAVLWDKSGSMEDKQEECKMIASALKCMTGTQNAFNIPDPKGGTALVDAVDSVIRRKIPGVTDILIVTDGDDTTSTVEKLVAGFADANGEPILVDFPERGNTAATRNARSEAVAEHFSHIGVRTFVVGLGEVKDFIATLAKKGDGRIITAHIPVSHNPDERLTVAQVGAVIATTLQRQPRGTVNAENATPLEAEQVRAIATETVVVANATPLSSGQVQEIAVQVARTSTRGERLRNPALLKDGPAYDPERQEAYVAFILQVEAAKIECDPADLRSALAWFRSLVRNLDVPVAGDLIGGRLWLTENAPSKGAVFSPPPGIKGKGHAWAAALGRCIELLARNPEAINAHKARVPGLDGAFAAEIRANSVGPLFSEAGQVESFLALTAEHLPTQLAHAVLYYKFKAGPYMHFVSHHRADAYSLVPHPDPHLAGMRVAVAGNSGKNTYGGPVVAVAPRPGAGPAAACEESSTTSEVDCADTASVADSVAGTVAEWVAESSSDEPEEVTQIKQLKRKLEVLEDANKKLANKLAAIRNTLSG